MKIEWHRPSRADVVVAACARNIDCEMYRAEHGTSTVGAAIILKIPMPFASHRERHVVTLLCGRIENIIVILIGVLTFYKRTSRAEK